MNAFGQLHTNLFACLFVGLKYGLLAAGVSGATFSQLVAGLLGYGFVAFLITFASAAIVSVLAEVQRYWLDR